MILDTSFCKFSGQKPISNVLRHSLFACISVLNPRLTEPGNPGYSKVIEKFGKGILNKDKTVNRLILGGIVFSDPSKLKALNEISHPIIAEMVLKEFKSIVSKDSKGIVFFGSSIIN